MFSDIYYGSRSMDSYREPSDAWRCGHYHEEEPDDGEELEFDEIDAEDFMELEDVLEKSCVIG